MIKKEKEQEELFKRFSDSFEKCRLFNKNFVIMEDNLPSSEILYYIEKALKDTKLELKSNK